MKHNDWSNRERESLKTISFFYFINGDRIDIDIRFCRKKFTLQLQKYISLRAYEWWNYYHYYILFLFLSKVSPSNSINIQSIRIAFLFCSDLPW